MSSNSERNPRLATLIACAASGAATFVFEALRAWSQGVAIRTTYFELCCALACSAGLVVGALASIARLESRIAVAGFVALAAGEVYGWIGAGVFGALAVGAGAWLAARDEAPLWSALARGSLFSVAAFGGEELRRVATLSSLAPEHAECARHALVFALGALLLAWLGKRRWVAAHSNLAAFALAVGCAAFALAPRWSDEAKTRATVQGASPANSAKLDPTAPNILVLVMDTVRADHTSVYGYSRDTTPELRAWLARRTNARSLEHAFSNGNWTVPSHASLFTGLLPTEHGAEVHARSSGALAIDAAVPVLAERLHDAGYATALVFANQWLRKVPGFKRGFDAVEYLEPPNPLRPVCDELREFAIPGACAQDSLPSAPAARVADALLARIDEFGAHTFFAAANFMDAHGPHVPLDDFAGRFGPNNARDRLQMLAIDNPPDVRQRVMDRYDEQILAVDAEVGRVLREVDRRHLFARTWIFVVADHGEAFGEHQVVIHGTSVYNAVTRVPLCVFPPDGVTFEAKPGAASLIDVTATIAALAGSAAIGHGVDLRASTSNSIVCVQAGGAPFLAESNGPLAKKPCRAVIADGYKLEENGENVELFELAADPREERDLAREHPEIVARLSPLLPPRIDAHNGSPDTKPLSADEARRMQQLGYGTNGH